MAPHYNPYYTPTLHRWVGDGPIEPRLFTHADKLYVTFNGAMSFDHKHSMDYTVMWDYDANKVSLRSHYP